MEVIDYKNSIVNLSNSILKYFGLKNFHNTLKEIDELLEKNEYQNVVLFLCDGLGSKNLEDYLGKNDFLMKNKIKNITSVFPPTTTAATTSVLTGKTPSEHNWCGWDMYFKDTDETISLYLNRVKETMKLSKVDISKRDYMKYESIVDLINKNTSSKAYYAYPFDSSNPCKNLDEVINYLTTLCHQDEKKFIYAYIENPDKLMHEYGIDSDIVKEEVKIINKKLETLATNLDNTLILVIADHGLVETKYINLKQDYEDIYNMLQRTTSIEARASGVKLKDKVQKEEFEKLFNLYLKDEFILLSVDKALEMNLFGNVKSEYLIDTIGDYLIVATGTLSINYDDTSPIFKANHAGLTKDELLVPLIVIDCNNKN